MMALSIGACGDDDTTTDAGPDAQTTDGGTDDAGADDAGADDAGADDAGADDTGTPDSGPVDCGDFFDLSEATADIPFVLPDTFDGTTPTWMHPVDMCPADTLSETAVPFVAYTYCNGLDVTQDFTFSMLTIDDPSDIEPLLVAYAGDTVAADPLACGAIEEAFGSFTAVEMVLTLEPGEVVTIVSTSRSVGEGDIQSVAEPTVED